MEAVVSGNRSQCIWTLAQGNGITHSDAQSPIFPVILESVKLAMLAIMGTHTQRLGIFITGLIGGMLVTFL